MVNGWDRLGFVQPEIRTSLTEAVNDLLTSRPGPGANFAALLTGSVARNWANKSSDIDILIISDEHDRCIGIPTADGLDGVRRTAYSKTGARVEIVLYDSSIISQLWRSIRSVDSSWILPINGNEPIRSIDPSRSNEVIAQTLFRIWYGICLAGNCEAYKPSSGDLTKLIVWRTHILLANAASILVDSDGMHETGNNRGAAARLQDASAYLAWAFVVSRKHPVDRAKWVYSVSLSHDDELAIQEIFSLRFISNFDLHYIRGAIDSAWVLLRSLEHLVYNQFKQDVLA